MNEIQVLAINSQNLAICWTVQIDSNNEFLRIVPAFALANGAITQSVVRSAVFSQDLRGLYVLAGNNTIIYIDAACAAESATLPQLTSLQVTKTLPMSAMHTVSVGEASLCCLCEPLAPLLPPQWIPVVDGRNSLGAVNLATGKLHRLSDPSLLPELLRPTIQFRQMVLKMTTHSKVGKRGCVHSRSPLPLSLECWCCRSLLYGDRLFSPSISLLSRLISCTLWCTRKAISAPLLGRQEWSCGPSIWWKHSWEPLWMCPCLLLSRRIARCF